MFGSLGMPELIVIFVVALVVSVQASSPNWANLSVKQSEASKKR